jgi:hypothetical protein
LNKNRPGPQACKSVVDDIFPMGPGMTIDGHGYEEDCEEDSYDNMLQGPLPNNQAGNNYAVSRNTL